MTRVPLLVTADELAGELGRRDLVVIDASVALNREQPGGRYRPRALRAEYEASHIPGAVFADLVEVLGEYRRGLPFAIPATVDFYSRASSLGIDDVRDVVVYSQDNPMWATRLWWLLRYHGLDRVSVLDGGLRAWTAAGHPAERGVGAPEPTRWSGRIRPELLATQATVLASQPSVASCLVNALAPEAFRGEGPTAYSRPGRIPGSISAPARTLFDARTLQFADSEVLRALLEPVLAHPADETIAYCGGGISATVVLFALELLGHSGARLYDGSLAEWTADPTMPVECG